MVVLLILVAALIAVARRCSDRRFSRPDVIRTVVVPSLAAPFPAPTAATVQPPRSGREPGRRPVPCRRRLSPGRDDPRRRHGARHGGRDDATSPSHPLRPQRCSMPASARGPRSRPCLRPDRCTRRPGCPTDGCSSRAASTTGRRWRRRKIDDPGTGSLVAHGIDGRGPRLSHGDAPAGWSGAGHRWPQQQQQYRPRPRVGRALRPCNGDLDADRDDEPGTGVPHGDAAARWQGPRGRRRHPRGAGSTWPIPPSSTTRRPAPGPSTGSMTVPRAGHAAVLLSTGQALAAGGNESSADWYPGREWSGVGVRRAV